MSGTPLGVPLVRKTNTATGQMRPIQSVNCVQSHAHCATMQITERVTHRVSTGTTMMVMVTVDTVMPTVRFVHGVAMTIVRGVTESLSHSSCITLE